MPQYWFSHVLKIQCRRLGHGAFREAHDVAGISRSCLIERAALWLRQALFQSRSSAVKPLVEAVCPREVIQVIAQVRTLASLGLKKAKDLVDGAPKPVLEKADKAAP